MTAPPITGRLRGNRPATENSTQPVQPERRTTLRRFALPLVLALLAVLLAASGCGGSSSNKSSASTGAAPAAPSSGSQSAELFSGSLAAVQGVKSAHYALDASVTIKASAQNANPQLAAFTKGPITVHFEGDASSKAFTADGSVGFAGQSFVGKLLLGEHEAYLNLLGQWYGSKSFGLADAQTKGAQSAGTSTQSIAKIRGQVDKVLTGDVSDGPETDGVATTKWEGTLNVDGIVALSKELGGKEIPAADLDKLRIVAGATKIVALVGKDDKLPRRFEFHLALSGDDLAKLGGTGSLAGVDSLSVDLTIDLSDYGKQVSFDAPAQFQPFSQLLGAFGGLAGAGG